MNSSKGPVLLYVNYTSNLSLKNLIANTKYIYMYVCICIYAFGWTKADVTESHNPWHTYPSLVCF